MSRLQRNMIDRSLRTCMIDGVCERKKKRAHVGAIRIESGVETSHWKFVKVGGALSAVDWETEGVWSEMARTRRVPVLCIDLGQVLWTEWEREDPFVLMASLPKWFHLEEEIHWTIPCGGRVVLDTLTATYHINQWSDKTHQDWSLETDFKDDWLKDDWFMLKGPILVSYKCFSKCLWIITCHFKLVKLNFVCIVCTCTFIYGYYSLCPSAPHRT